MITDETAQRLAKSLDRLAAALETHLTPRPRRTNRKRHEQKELDHWIQTDSWDGGGS